MCKISAQGVETDIELRDVFAEQSEETYAEKE